MKKVNIKFNACCCSSNKHGEIILNDENGEQRIVAVSSEISGLHFMNYLKSEEKISEGKFKKISSKINTYFKQGP